MKSLVVLFAVASVACASWAPGIVTPYAHSVAIAPTVLVAAPSAVSHQSRIDVHSSPALVRETIAVPSPYGYGTLGLAGIGYGHGHWLHKRSLGHYAVAAPAAVSHQSRVDVITKPAVVSHAVVAPVVTHAAPVVAVAPAAVSHQSRVDVHASPAVVAHGVVPVGYSAGYYNGLHGYNNGYLGLNVYNGYNSAPWINGW